MITYNCLSIFRVTRFHWHLYLLAWTFFSTASHKPWKFTSCTVFTFCWSWQSSEDKTRQNSFAVCNCKPKSYTAAVAGVRWLWGEKGINMTVALKLAPTSLIFLIFFLVALDRLVYITVWELRPNHTTHTGSNRLQLQCISSLRILFSLPPCILKEISLLIRHIKLFLFFSACIFYCALQRQWASVWYKQLRLWDCMYWNNIMEPYVATV